MAHHDSVKDDPAIERWNRMREDVYKNFRWTSRMTRTAFWGLVFVPGALYYLSAQSDLRWNWAGKRKGESLSIKPASE